MWTDSFLGKMSLTFRRRFVAILPLSTLVIPRKTAGNFSCFMVWCGDALLEVEERHRVQDDGKSGLSISRVRQPQGIYQIA